jgi:MPBQ/MSBQ methyltransferase
MSTSNKLAHVDGLKINTALRFYHEILGLDQLHYGLWENDDFTMNGLKVAQERYSDHLISYFPDSVKVVLDAGAGTGATSQKLQNKGYDVDALSPDPYQQHLFKKNRNVDFHLARFQNFKPQKKYDLVLMSESCQYIPMQQLFISAKQCAAGGYLLIDDYFITHPDNTAMSKSGHKLDAFYKEAEKNGFELIRQEDITDKAAISLDLAKDWVERFVLPSIELLTYSFSRKHPKTFSFIRWLARKKIRKFNDDLMLLNAEHFKRVKRYKILLFKIPA